MQFLSLILLAMSAGALPQSQPATHPEALTPTTIPSNNALTSRALEKRNTAWIGSFKDQHCQGSHVGEGIYRPKIHEGTKACYPFELQDGVDYINIYWGSGDDVINSLLFYPDPHCKEKAFHEEPIKSNSEWTCLWKGNLNKTVHAVAEKPLKI